MPQFIPKVLLIELPSMPKGVLSLSLPAVAACLRPYCHVDIIDLNFIVFERSHSFQLFNKNEIDACGLKVSSQNINAAIDITQRIKKISSSTKPIWGGELPTLLPQLAAEHADCVVRGMFEPVAKKLADDLLMGCLQREYQSDTLISREQILIPALDLVRSDNYLTFMGLPLDR